MSQSSPASSPGVAPLAGAVFGMWRRAGAVRWERAHLVAVLVLVHVLLGALGRLIGIAGTTAHDLREAAILLAYGIAADALATIHVAVPAAMLLLVLPGRWYRTFAVWMLVGALSLAGIAFSVCIAIERARGALTGTLAELVAGAATTGSLWFGHPVAAALVLAAVSAVLLLGPVRHAADRAFGADFDDRVTATSSRAPMAALDSTSPQ